MKAIKGVILIKDFPNFTCITLINLAKGDIQMNKAIIIFDNYIFKEKLPLIRALDAKKLIKFQL